jgi:cytochrome b subunit of formate dehydrogenase
MRPAGHPRSKVSRQNVMQTCAACHGPGGPAAARTGERRLLDYRDSVHGRPDPARPGLYPAVCTECHGTHSILPASDPRSTVSKVRAAETCGACHTAELKEYRDSIHAQSLAAGGRDAPSCADCHGEHDIQRVAAPGSRVSRVSIVETCARCHEDKTLIDRYGLPANLVKSYRKSYHGVANRFGEVEVASCSSCHNPHRILPQSDPRSSIHPDNLPATCGQEGCHPGVGRNVALGSVHLDPSPTRDRAVYWVSILFGIFTYGTILGLTSLVVLDSFRRWRTPKSLRQREDSADPLDQVKVPRFTRVQLLQHQILLTTFILLVITGFPIKFPDWTISQWIINAVGGVTARGAIHRLMGAILLLAGVWHVLWVVTSPRGWREFLRMLPERDDPGRAVGILKYFFGLSKEFPPSGKFSLYEKFDYMAVGWGSVIMGVTGLALWFPHIALQIAPKWALDVCHVVHSDEAVLAFLAITIWHFYHVHYKPTIWPMNTTWLDGQVRLGDLKEEHRLEYERLRAELEAGGLPAVEESSEPAGPEAAQESAVEEAGKPEASEEPSAVAAEEEAAHAIPAEPEEVETATPAAQKEIREEEPDAEVEEQTGPAPAEPSGLQDAPGEEEQR